MKIKITVICICIYLTCFWVWQTSAQIITIYAGTGAQGFSGDGGQATNAELYWPVGLTIDYTGNIYIGSNRGPFRKVDTTGIISTFAGTDSGTIYNGDSIPATTARISTNQLAVDQRTGIVYIADGGNRRIRKVDLTTGLIFTIAGTGIMGYSGDGGPATAAKLIGPVSIACDSNGNLYFADGSYRIRKVDTNNIITTIAGTGVTGFSGDGGPASAATFGTVSALCVDNKGNIFVGDALNYRIRKIDQHGNITTFAGNGTETLPLDSGDGGQATRASVESTSSIAADNAGNIYTSDPLAHRIRRIDVSGIITTIAGNGTMGFSGEGGSASAAVIGNPAGICIDDKKGAIYFNDQPNNVVMKIQYPASLSINEPQLLQSKIQLYPDPVLNQCFTIKLNDPTEQVSEIYICNTLGQKISELHNTNNSVTNVQLQNAPPGVYFVTVHTTSGNWSGKIVVK